MIYCVAGVGLQTIGNQVTTSVATIANATAATMVDGGSNITSKFSL